MHLIGKKRLFDFLPLLVLCLNLPASWGVAQTSMPVNNAADTSSPQATLNSFIDSCNEFHRRIRADHYFDRSSQEHRPFAARVIDCLDVSGLPDFEQHEAAGEAAIYLKEILDRVKLPADDEIPGDGKDAASGGDAASGEDVLTHWRIPGTRITIARVEEGPRRHEYLFSSGTVGRAREYFLDMKSAPYRTAGRETTPGFYEWYFTAPANPWVAKVVDRLPDWFRYQAFEMARWKWIGLILAALTTMCLMGLVYRFYNRLGNRYCDDSPWRFFLTIVFPVAAILIPLGFKHFVFEYLTLRGEMLYFTSFIANVVAILALIVFVFGVSNRIAAAVISTPRINPQGLDAQFIRILSKLLSIMTAVIVFVEGGRYLGFDATTLLASAGVGGFAVALAAQDTLKNVFGTIMLLTDKPFRVGERIVFAKYDGVVEEIGLRSTKIRLLSGHLAAVPNNELASTDIENVGRRPFIRRSAVLELPSATSVARVKRALEIVRAALENHEGMEESRPPRAYLRDLNEASIGIFFMYWYHPPDYWDFLAFSERVNLLIMEQLEAEQIPFAAPSLTVQTSDGHEQPD